MSKGHQHNELVFPANSQRGAVYFCAECDKAHVVGYGGCTALRGAPAPGPVVPLNDKYSTAPGVPLDPLKPASERQVGGDHYTKLKIQPMRYSLANRLDAAQHTIIQYVTRFRDKGGLADLEKARHTLDLLIEYETEASRDR